MDLKDLTGFSSTNTKEWDETIIMQKLDHSYDTQIKLTKTVEETKAKYRKLLSAEQQLREELGELEFGGVNIGGRRTTMRLIERSQSYFDIQQTGRKEMKMEWVELNQIVSNLSLFLSHLNDLCKEFILKEEELPIVSIPSLPLPPQQQEKERDVEKILFSVGEEVQKNQDSRVCDIIQKFEMFEQFAFEICRRFRKIKNSEKKKKKEEKKKDDHEDDDDDNEFQPLISKKRKMKYLRIEPPSLVTCDSINQFEEFTISPKNIRVNVDDTEDQSEFEYSKSSRRDSLLRNTYFDIYEEKTTTATTKEEEQEEQEDQYADFDEPIVEVFDRKQIKFMSRLAVIRGKKRASFQAKFEGNGKRNNGGGMTPLSFFKAPKISSSLKQEKEENEKEEEEQEEQEKIVKSTLLENETKNQEFEEFRYEDDDENEQ